MAVLSRLSVALSLLLLWLAPVRGSAQIPPVTEAPPPIPFSDWKRVGSVGEAEQFSASFSSAISTEQPENNTVPLQIFMPAKHDGPVPAIVLLHYWGATDLKVERALGIQLASQGIGAAIMVLPYHLQRTPVGFRSGALAIQPDPDKLIRTMTQSVMDVRRTVDFLASRPEVDSKKIGIGGTSLGSLVAALAYGVEPRFQLGVFMLGGVDLAHIIWNSSRVVAERESLRREGFTEELLRTQLRSIEPSEYLKGRAVSPTFVVGARYDTVIPGESTLGLIKDLQGCVTLWLDTGHYGGVFVQRKLLAEVVKFVKGSFGNVGYKPAESLSAPTVRLGAELGSGSGFNIEVGLDLIKPKGPRAPMASALLAPRGPRLFLGHGIDRGIALGVFVKPGQPSIGLLWSTVL